MDDSFIVDLADRRSADLEVVLWWAKRSGRFWVSVTNRNSGLTGRVDATADNALEVFQHPCVYEAESA